jgi:Zn-dependent peptidase ImmA (M78 family)/DNA-binding XRE family transcriptional regulator
MKGENLAYITPSIITWARGRQGLSPASLGEMLGVSSDRVLAWEKDEHPTFNQAVTLARTLKIPFGYLFLAEPPETPVPLPDLRTRRGERPKDPSAEFLDVLYGVLNRQEWYREQREERGGEALPFVHSFDARKSTTIAVASAIRKQLGINRNLRAEVSNWAEYFREIRTSAERAGILVMRSGIVENNTSRPLSPDEFQGFAVADRLAPLIFVNGRDFISAQIFTLAHELAHIWIGVTGISNADETGTTPAEDIEKYCNEVAAETLVPEFEFRHYWQGRSPEFLVGELARHFRVSSLVILRRAFEFGLIARQKFFELVEAEREKLKKKTGGGGGSFYKNVLSRFGATFTHAVVTDVREGRTLYRDAGRLLGINPANVVKFMDWSG